MSDAILAVATPDTLVLLGILLAAAWGWWRGFVAQVVRALGLAFAFALASRVDVPVGRWLADRFSFVPAGASDVWGWGATAIVTFLLVCVLAAVLRRAVHAADLGGIDRTLGAALGAVVGLLLCTLACTMWASTKEPGEVRATFEGSRIAPLMGTVVETVTPLFPPGVRARWSPVLRSLDAAPL